MSELPKGWVETSLEDLVTKDGFMCDGNWVESKDQDPNGSARLIQLADIGDGNFINKSSRFMSPEKVEALNCTLLKKGDILISRLGDPLGKTCIFPGVGQDAVTVVDVHILRTDFDIIDNRYLTYFINAPQTKSTISSLSSGTTRRRITGKKIKSLSFPVPPVNEQKRIAQKLDQILEEVNSARARLDQIPTILKNFRSSILAYASSGQLTQDWRTKNNITLDSWKVKSGQDIFPFITSGSRGWAKYYSEEGPIFLRVGNLDHQTINLDLSSLQHVTPPLSAEGKRTRIELGDILISITADVGMVALIADDIGEAYINQHLCLARQSGDYNGQYLGYYLASPVGGLVQLTNMQRGATKAGLTLGDIREISIKIPSLEEQQEIVDRVESFLGLADQIEEKYNLAKEQVDKITQSVLAKAFRGELVPQDPNDEPASILLEHIKAEKEAESLKPKPKRKKKTLSKSDSVQVPVEA